MKKNISSYLFFITLVFQLNLTAKANPWAEVDAYLNENARQGILTNNILEIRNKNHELLFKFEVGNVDRKKDLPVLSSGKWVSAVTAMTLVDRGILSLESPMSQYLRNRDGSAIKAGHDKITYRNLLSFQSGIYETHPCYAEAEWTLEECSFQILESSPFNLLPGTSFRYGNANFTLVALMSEKAAKKSWQQIFEENIVGPLGMKSKPAFYAKPKKKQGAANPSPGHGLRISYDDYLKFMKMVMDEGQYEGRQVVSQQSIHEVERDQFNSETTLGRSVAAGTSLLHFGHYGLGSWYECKDMTCKQGVTSSFGLFGFYPWLDRNTGYYAVLGGWDFDKELVYKDAIEIVQKLKPMIDKAIMDSKK